MAPRLLKQLVAIILGNLVYFFLLMPHLPARAQHQPHKLDLGLLVDFWFCVVVYGLIELASRKWREKKRA
jgi:hypothetical protein